jgi:esterase/lipase superfamily enzyme
MSDRMRREITLVRWGETGTPVLLFPTAGGDAEEIERFHLVTVLSDFLTAGLIKIYSVDSLAGRAWLTEDNTSGPATRVQNQYDAALFHEVLPAIRKDCGDPEVEIITSGASLGAYNALAFLCRHPEVCKAAICMSGTYGLEKFLEGPVTQAYHDCSPLHFVPDLEEDGAQLKKLRERFVLLTHGEGRAESPEEDWQVANALGARDIPNRVDSWGPDYPHDWVTWREMLPKYLAELVGDPAPPIELPDVGAGAVVEEPPGANDAPKEPT